MKSSSSREQFATRLGFLAMTAGCAIGLGNIWRFPYICGQYGGACFVLVYILCLILIGFPVMAAELALGRASQSDLVGAYKTLGPAKHNHWPVFGHIVFTGNIFLLMFYTVITGWMFYYCAAFAADQFPAGRTEENFFGGFLANWKIQLFYTLLGIAVTAGICMRGVKKGVEKAMKIMLAGLFLMQFILIAVVLHLNGAGEGLRFFLAPDINRMTSCGLWPVIHAAMMQAFFTLSLGIGSVAICGSYIGKDHSLTKETILIITLDTVAAIAAGLIIFPACFAYHVEPGQGPSLIFITLTKVFRNMAGGRFWGMLFFAFMSVAALSTLVAVAENIIAYVMRTGSCSRKTASWIFAAGMSVLSLPCLFGFNLLKNVHPLGKDSGILDLEDFIVSDNLLPLGAIAILLFCTRRFGWGMQNFLNEVNTGKGMRFPAYLGIYMRWLLPLVIFGLWLHNLICKFR